MGALETEINLHRAVNASGKLEILMPEKPVAFLEAYGDNGGD